MAKSFAKSHVKSWLVAKSFAKSVAGGKSKSFEDWKPKSFDGKLNSFEDDKQQLQIHSLN